MQVSPDSYRWSVDTGNCGVVDATGKYTAPSTVPTAMNCPVTATSLSDAAKRDTAIVALAASPPPPEPPPPSPPTVHIGTFSYLASYPRLCSPAIGPGFPAGALTVCSPPNESPLATFPVPLVNGSYVDANFGTTVRVLAHNALHGYSTPSALTATGKYALLNIAGADQIVESVSTKVIGPGTQNVTNQSPRPHATDDDIFYFTKGSQFKQRRISTGVDTLVLDIASIIKPPVLGVTVAPKTTNAGPGDSRQFSATTQLGPPPTIMDGGSGNVTTDGWYGFLEMSTQQACVANMVTGKLICHDYSGYGAIINQGFFLSHGPDSSNGKRYAVIPAHPSAVFLTLNEVAGTLDFAFRGPDMPRNVSHLTNDDGKCDPGEYCLSQPHWDMAHDAQNRQYILTMADIGGIDPGDPCGQEVVLLPLASEGRLIHDRKRIARQNTCGGLEPWNSNHMGCSTVAPVCVVSFYYGIFRDPADMTSPIPNGNYGGELWSMRLDSGVAQIKRLVKHRSTPWTNDQYWSTPRPSPSADGKSLVWGTNFGYPRPGSVVVAATGF